MKAIILNIFAAISLIPSCSKSTSQIGSKVSQEEVVNHEYSEVVKYTIIWESIFEQEKDKYFVYFYSLTCSHCASLKNDIISYALKSKNLYFVQASEDVHISEDITDSIGAISTNDLAIKGYPSLIEIDQKVCVSIASGTQEIISKLNL